jgi:hypothetical protein
VNILNLLEPYPNTLTKELIPIHKNIENLFPIISLLFKNVSSPPRKKDYPLLKNLIFFKFFLAEVPCLGLKLFCHSLPRLSQLSFPPSTSPKKINRVVKNDWMGGGGLCLPIWPG